MMIMIMIMMILIIIIMVGHKFYLVVGHYVIAITRNTHTLASTI